jgi:hypothetical protein
MITCPNGHDDRPTCTHPMCPVHKTNAERAANAAEWSDIIFTAQSRGFQPNPDAPPSTIHSVRDTNGRWVKVTP